RVGKASAGLHERCGRPGRIRRPGRILLEGFERALRDLPAAQEDVRADGEGFRCSPIPGTTPAVTAIADRPNLAPQRTPATGHAPSALVTRWSLARSAELGR